MMSQAEFETKAYHALCISIHMWTFLAETGRQKIDWAHYDDFNIGEADSECLLCPLYAFPEVKTPGMRCIAYGTRCPLMSAEQVSNTYMHAYYACADGAYATWEAALDEGQAQRGAQKLLDKLKADLNGRELLSIEELLDVWRSE